MVSDRAIDGVVVTPLKRIEDARGAVLHMLRADAPHFAGFGEIYYSVVNRGVVKGWKRHTRMTLSLTAPFGGVRLGLIDGRPDSPTYAATQTVVIDPSHYVLVTVPPGVWSAFQGLTDPPAVLANCANIPHDPTEAETVAADQPPVPYRWPEA